MNIQELISTSYKISKDHGFWDEAVGQVGHNKGEKFMLMVTELAEGFEGIRHGNPLDSHCPEFTSEEVELADCMIRIADYAGYYKLRLEQAIAAKLEYNITRPHKHGNTC